MSDRFDKLAKRLAERGSGEGRGVPRREALWRLGGSLAGAMLVSLGIGRTWAQDGGGDPEHGNDECAKVCNTIYPPGRERGKCKSAGAHGEGICPQICVGAGGCGNVGSCGNDPGCVCFLTVEEFGFCHRPQSCGGLQECSATLECAVGEACVVTCCGPTPVCIQPCLPGVAAVPEGPTTVG